MNTYSVKQADIERNWIILDADGRILGDLATEIACLLMGKGKVKFARHLDVGDNVVVVNAAKIKVTGNKMKDKFYYRHSGYPGGFKSENLEKVMDTKPEKAIEHAVKGMLPQNKLGKQMMSKLRVYAGAEHPHTSQVQLTAEDKA
ncbi:MAG: 50S ribosomal protein L13 [Dehalococcoidales bacterium]|mgnify:CR=1 FL=1|jgi:large subunit ribosomal protein L13|nr:50S ribosomal protein L13 [Dehalococcoidales bacterium]MDD3264493.1 50S ribosomal protein L13 [Dehalococcoidales bacterium]MDD4322024.1 50S ribosomal protein L13 [Dehalococcoidales bacterium]MDD4793883.1 50S ribosomal protein L13 [Dehalococcoidales bacterium]MDD5122063.1 50S ribosomal protein L13 [Dehalococcoidales bacterium]